MRFFTKDAKGKWRKISIPNALYVPEAAHTLLSADDLEKIGLWHHPKGVRCLKGSETLEGISIPLCKTGKLSLISASLHLPDCEEAVEGAFAVDCDSDGEDALLYVKDCLDAGERAHLMFGHVGDNMLQDLMRVYPSLNEGKVWKLDKKVRGACPACIISNIKQKGPCHESFGRIVKRQQCKESALGSVYFGRFIQ